MMTNGKNTSIECSIRNCVHHAQAEEYCRLAALIDGNETFSVPNPLTAEGLEELVSRYCL